MKILVTTQMMLTDQVRFERILSARGYTTVFVPNDQFLRKTEALNLTNDFDGWISGDDEIDEEVIAHFLPKLKVISKWGAGTDSIDKQAATRLGVAVKSSPGAFAMAVGEMAVAYTLALSRGIVDTHQKVTQGRWPKPQHRSLSELRVGIIGAGAIGSSTIKLLSAFGPELRFFDPYVDSISTAEKSDLPTLCQCSDVVVITCPLMPATKGMVDSALLSRLPKGSFLINVSRGGVIDQTALLNALKSGHLAGAALDVYEQEPLPMDSELRNYNVILGSHNANNTHETVERVHEKTIQALDELLR